MTAVSSSFAMVFLLIVLLLLCRSPLGADWINLTGVETSPNIAEIHVGDLETLDALIMNGWLKDSAAPHPPLKERLKQFATLTFQVASPRFRRKTRNIRRLRHSGINTTLYLQPRVG
jgi:hypothetical protein